MQPRWQKVVKDYAEALIIALVLAFFIRSFVVQAFKIPSGSMLETLQVGDHLLVNKFVYGIKLPFTNTTVIPVSDPEHGDIVVFKYPMDEDIDYIKRVIGTPGDRIRIEDKQVYRNGEPIDDPYAQYTDKHSFKMVCDGPPNGESMGCPCRDNISEFTVPPGKYFMMGDNRDASKDSRCWGYVDRKLIRGRAWMIYWSWAGIGDIRWGRIGDTMDELTAGEAG
jgi:signal peptidase I